MTVKSLPARIIDCPTCGEKVKFTNISGMSGRHVHFYALDSNDIIMREEWSDKLEELISSKSSDAEIENYFSKELLRLRPEKRYSIWANVKCPNCNTEFPYRFVGNLKARLQDLAIILIDGCEIDTDAESFTVKLI
jgi:hypothetical protein